MHQERRWFSAVAVALLVGASAPASHATTVYVGLPNGAGLAYTCSTPGGAWARKSSADLPAAEYYAAPTLADLDGDGDRDALVGQEHGAVIAYRNDGTDGAPSWVRMTAWDLPAMTCSHSAPALVDLDGDGDRDVLVGGVAGRVEGVENVGTRTAPAWQVRAAWSLGDLGDDTRPAAGDIDGDGAADVLVGTRTGAVLAYRGTGSAAAPLARNAAWDAPVVGQKVSPALADLDQDGRPDLLLAEVNARFFAFRNVGGTWTQQTAWAPPDPGSGPIGVGCVGGGGAPVTTTTLPPTTTTLPTATTTTVAPTTTTTTLPPGGGTPVARLSATPASGAAPLAVHLDASASSDPDGQALTFAWDFGDGMVVGAPAPDAVLSTVDADYNAAKATRDAGHYEQAIDAYLAVVANLLPLTTITTTGPVTVQGTNRVDRVARWYLQKIAHDIGGIYLYHALGLSECDRFAMSLQFSRESAAQAVAGGFPQLPDLNGTSANIADATQHLQAASCTIPAYEPMFTTPAVEAGAVVDHVYDQNGTYTAKVTVRDGANASTTSVTITVGALPPPPPPAEGDDPHEGFGATTLGGAGGRVIHVTEATDKAVRAAVASANNGGKAIIVFDVTGPIAIKPSLSLTGSYVTVEGNGATLRGEGVGQTNALFEVKGHDVIVRNLRLRNGGDNLRAQGSGAYNVVFSHISSTGSRDDGVSIGYGAHDVTVQWCFFAGNTRSIFMKYSTTTNVTIHHTWIMKQWVRGPLVSGNILADLRNLIVQDWTMWGTRFESTSSGNAVDSRWRLSPYAHKLGGKTNGALRFTTTKPVFAAGNVFDDMAQDGPQGTASAPYTTPAVTTQSVAEMTPLVEARAGVQPRDAVDQAYIDLANGWKVGESTPLRLPF